MFLPLNPARESAQQPQMRRRHAPSTTLGAFCWFSSPCPRRPYLTRCYIFAARKRKYVLSAAPRVELATVSKRCGARYARQATIFAEGALVAPAVCCQPQAIATMHLPSRPLTTVGFLTLAAWGNTTRQGGFRQMKRVSSRCERKVANDKCLTTAANSTSMKRPHADLKRP